MLTATGLAKAYGARQLFEGVTLSLAPGRRAALVGGNGTGKTTLLEIVVGRTRPDGGEIHRPRELRVGYLPQEGLAVPEGTVLDEVRRGAGRAATLGEELGRLEAGLRDAADEATRARLLAEYGAAQAEFEQLGGYALDAEAHRVLAGLGFDPADADRPVREMSGGWRMRVALGRLLLGQPDLLVLDEPTNHLDLDSVAWLEEQLAAWPGVVLFVSHDRDFIDAVANRVLHLSAGTVTEYVGGFAEFVVEREERMARLRAAAAQQEKEIARTERFIERFRYKASKARQVQSRAKMLDRLERIEVPDDRELRLRFGFPPPPRVSRVVAELEDVEVGYGDAPPVLSSVDLVVERGQCVALVGPNGAGKTTLLRVVLGELAPNRGEVTLGANVVPARFTQHQAEELDPSRTVLGELKASAAQLGPREQRGLLGAFGFPGDTVDRRVGDLSGGERSRLALAKLMVEPVNLLVLDEPTNHLDLPSCDVLEDALRAWPGTILLVTHDRHLVRSVATNVVEVRGGTATWHHGVDETALLPASRRGDAGSSVPTTEAAPGATAAPEESGTAVAGARRADRRRAAERRERVRRETAPVRDEIAAAERRWEQAEEAVAELQRRLADPAVYERPDEVARLARDHDRAKHDAAEAMAEWERATVALERLEATLDQTGN